MELLCLTCVANDYVMIHTMRRWNTIRADYPVAGNELIEDRWSTKLCSLSVLNQLIFCRWILEPLWSNDFCRSYWGVATVDYNSYCLSSVKPAGPFIEQPLAASEQMGHISCLCLDMPSAPTKRKLSSRYKPFVRVYTFSCMGVQLYLHLILNFKLCLFIMY